MLVLSRHRDEKIIIGGQITIQVLDIIEGRLVRLGITAPRDVTVHRSEVAERIEREGHRSAESLTVAKDGLGDRCPACGATNTYPIPAQPAHSRCLCCGNAWGPDDAA